MPSRGDTARLLVTLPNRGIHAERGTQAPSLIHTPTIAKPALLGLLAVYWCTWSAMGWP